MQVKTIYVSALGRECSTAKEALSDEDRLPRIIALYEKDLATLRAGGPFAGKTLPADHPERAEEITRWEAVIADYKEKWAGVQAQRAAAGVTAPSYHDVVVYVGEKRVSLFNAGFGLDLRCCRAAGWELWDMTGGHGHEKQLAGEYGEPRLCVEVLGVVVVGVRPENAVDAHAGGWNGRVQVGP